MRLLSPTASDTYPNQQEEPIAHGGYTAAKQVEARVLV